MKIFLKISYFFSSILPNERTTKRSDGMSKRNLQTRWETSYSSEMKNVTCAVAKETVTKIVCFTRTYISGFPILCTEGVGVAVIRSLSACSKRIA